MFKDPAARRAWRHFRLRAEMMLGSVSPKVRRELIDELAMHVRDIVEHSPEGDEAERVNAALARVGDPLDFLTPLVGEAVLRQPHQNVGASQAWRVIFVTAANGSALAASAVWIAVMALFAAMMLLVSLGSLVRPENIGLFLIGADDYQLRLLGGVGGTPVFAPWLGLMMLCAGLFIGRLALHASRRLALKIIVMGAAGK